MAIIVELENGTVHKYSTIQEIKLNCPMSQVVSLTAKEQELDYIKAQYVTFHGIIGSDVRVYSYSIPVPRNATTVMWFGDIAKTIAVNL